MSIPINFWTWICALLPILVILVLMIGFKWSASKAGHYRMGIALIIAIAVFRADFNLLAKLQRQSMVMAFLRSILFGVHCSSIMLSMRLEESSIGATFIDMTTIKSCNCS